MRHVSFAVVSASESWVKVSWQVIFGAEHCRGKMVLCWKPGNRLIFTFVVLLINDPLIKFY